MKIIKNFIRFIINSAKFIYFFFYGLCVKDYFGYKYNYNDIWLGSRLLIFGYPKMFKEEIVENKDGLIKYNINDFEFYTLSGLFKELELEYIYNEVFLTADINPHAYETDFLKISPGDTVIDAGSCEGFFIKYSLAKNVDKIYVFEPYKGFITGIEKTYRDSIKTGRIVVVEKALSNETGTANINFEKNFICETTLESNGKDTVTTVTIDDYFYKNDIKVDYIKMDIEGAEMIVIEGAVNTLKKYKPKLSIAVYHGYENAIKIKRYLENLNVNYEIKYGGCYMFEKPYRPFMLYAF